MKTFILSVLLVLVSLAGASAQTTNDVRLSAGGLNVNHINVFTANAEVRKAITNRFEFDNTLSTATDGDTTLVQNRGGVKAFLTNNIFIAGGLSVGKVSDQDVFLNPSLQAGLNFNVSKVNLEPYVQLDTTDLLSTNKARSLTVALVGKVNLSDRFGILGSGGVRSTRLDNAFFTEASAQRFAQAGVFFNF